MTDEAERLGAALEGRYRIERELGHGGMATVYLGEDLKHERQVAVKVLHPDLAAVLGAERFLREVKITARLDHPHILPLLDSGVAGDFLYYVMPFVEGESLRDRLDRERQLPLADAVQITCEVADALSYAHSHDVVHRDIKPENVLLSGGHARIADFGIARAITAAGGETLTQTGMAIGTPAYMSPEQATGVDRVDGRSDIYSLGCMLYETLAGEPPFTGPSVQALLARKSVDAVPPITTVREAVPGSIEAALGKALARLPADRFVTAQQFTDALGTPVVAPTPASRPRRNRKLIIAGVGLAALVVVITFGVLGGVPFVVRPAAASFYHQRDPVIVAEFRNGTAQPALGLAVREALVTDLDQSPYVDVVERGQVAAVVRRMQLPDTALVDADVAVEIAKREGYPVVVAGAVTPLGSGYQLTVRIIEASTGEVAVRLRETAKNDADVVPTVEKLVRRARLHLGESLGSVRRSDPLPQVTTTSLETLQLYARANVQTDRGNYRRAIELLHAAVEIDTSFAAGYRALGILHSNLGDPKNGQPYTDRAYHFSERLPGPERLLIAAAYHSYRGRLDSATYYYRRLLDRYGDEYVALNNLGDIYERTGRYQDALPLYRKALSLRPSITVLVNLASAARSLGRFELADSVAAEMRAKYPDAFATWQTAAANAWYANDEATLAGIGHSMSESEEPGRKLLGAQIQAALSATHGQLIQALAFSDSTIYLAARSGSFIGEIQGLIMATWSAFAAGVPESAVPSLERMSDPGTLGGVPLFYHFDLGFRARTYALAGNVRQAQVLLARMDSVVEANDFAPPGITEQVRAVIALQQGNAEEALLQLDRGQAMNYGLIHHSSRLLRGDAYTALGRYREAAAQYDTLSATYGLNFLDVSAYEPLRPLAHERAATAYLALGDTATAIEHLAKFVDLWEDADPALQPVVTEERERMAQLVKSHQ